MSARSAARASAVRASAAEASAAEAAAAEAAAAEAAAAEAAAAAPVRLWAARGLAAANSMPQSFGGGRRPSMGHRASSALRSFGRGRQASRRLSNGATPSFPPLLAPYGTRIHVSQRSKGSVEARDQAEVLLCFCPLCP